MIESDRTILYKSVTKSNIPHSGKKKNLPKKLCPALVVKSIPQSGIKRQRVIERGRSGTYVRGSCK